jgi:DMSO/TMAO reductase YedYZ molybdopterin-dependent catalytic subunit
VRSLRLVGALVGILSAAVAVGVGEFVAAFVRAAAAPVIAVGNRIIVLTPESAKQTTIQAAGTNDKLVLLAAIYLLLAALGAVIGVAALHRLRYGLAGVAAIGAFGVYCALTQNAARGTDAVPTLVGTAAAMAVLVVLVRLVRRAWPPAASEPAASERGASEPAATHGSATDTGRRTLLQAGVASAALAAAGGFGGRAVQHSRFDVTAARAKVTLPAPRDHSALPRGVELGKTPEPWATSNADFYRIDTALSVPQVDPKAWRLRIHGLVDHELTLSYEDVLARPLIERWITLCCVSNEVGGSLVGNARFRGTLLADLLREAGVHPASDQLVLTSVDGMTIGAPTKVVMDGRDSLLAVGMNGKPLPIEHGFPARTVVPGLYGYVSACKWIVDIEATTFADRQAYWVQGGWAARPPIRLASRIDRPSSSEQVSVGDTVAVAGVAWDQHVGVSRVEVQVDDGPWQRARLAAVPSSDTWRQWVWPWTPEKSGTYRLRVRAFDGKGRPQDTKRRAPFPSGASGLHSVTVHALI